MGLIKLLTHFLYKIREWFWGPQPVTGPAPSLEPEPRRGKIDKEPLVALKDGQLVVVVDHTFEDVPSWVEWDQDRQVLSIAQMGGQVEEAKVEISKEYYQVLENSRKLLLVSNDNKKKIAHYVMFISRK